jgi:hypothetical protein
MGEPSGLAPLRQHVVVNQQLLDVLVRYGGRLPCPYDQPVVQRVDVQQFAKPRSPVALKPAYQGSLAGRGRASDDDGSAGAGHLADFPVNDRPSFIG